MATNNFSLYIPKEKRELLSLCNELSLDGELSNFIVEAMEMHQVELVHKRLKHHKDQVEYWEDKQLRIIDQERVQKERMRQDIMAPRIRQCKIVEDTIDEMVSYNGVDPKHDMEYGILVTQIQERGGPSISAEALEGIYKRRLKGEAIKYLEELKEELKR